MTTSTSPLNVAHAGATSSLRRLFPDGTVSLIDDAAKAVAEHIATWAAQEALKGAGLEHVKVSVHVDHDPCEKRFVIGVRGSF